jgi:hypothetical protein
MQFNSSVANSVLGDSSAERILDYAPVADHRETLPFAAADAVVIGSVVGGKSYVSNDYTRIYSEYRVRLILVLRNKTARQVAVGTELNLVRAGGVVKLDSGKILIRGCANESQPRVGKQYAFFLRYSLGPDDFPIIAGYELSDDGVFALDSVQQHAVGSFGLGIYGKGIDQFMAALQSAANAH